MPQLDDLVSQWAEQLRTSHPHIAPHVDEIADHVQSSAAEHMKSGISAGQAFATALGSFGAPADLAKEFGKNVKVRRHAERATVVAHVIASFVFTALVLGIQANFGLGTQVTVWILVAWVLVTTPLHEVLLRRARRGVPS